ncbi:MAG TPA: cytochrome c3 family protein [Myxococcota bacterium]|nr:cytochrome c3 family protein [Myxococcota bacterium]
MTIIKRRQAVVCLAGVFMLFLVGCGDETTGQKRTVGESVITLELPDVPGAFPASFIDLRRPPVEYDHAAHVKALGKQGCDACHPIEGGRLTPLFKRKTDTGNRDELTELYHRECLGCHKQASADGKKAGPLACSGCHAIRQKGVSAWREIRFDYSLHFRHVKAKEEKCDSCHHVFDKLQKKLVYKKKSESACRDCHGKRDEGKKLSLRNAAHRDCINCHLERKAKGQKAGPERCVGCHSEEKQLAIEKLPVVPRLQRGQPNLTWIHSPEIKTAAVLFDHLRHEKASSSCSTCHHKTLKACRECHKPGVKGTDGAVSLEQAYHLTSSEHSCAGCHKKQTAKKTCRGCHYILGEQAGKKTCRVCHSGPKMPAGQTKLPQPMQAPFELDALPAISADFPEKVSIASLAKDYQAAGFPHFKIITALNKNVRANGLAGAFHGKTSTLCTGCHHHSPPGMRPAACRSCHDKEGPDMVDKPGLFSAYHRQCIGCHQEMGIKKQGCTDCHKKASREVAR